MVQLKIFLIGLIDMWRHPKYYKELRKRNKLDQAISGKNSTECKTRSPGPGLKHQATEASSFRTNLVKRQATSGKATSTGVKRQATSSKLSDPRTTVQEY